MTARRSTVTRQRSYLRGHLAEWACMAWLCLKGYSILERRHRNPLGEIDIIASRGRQVAFIEVKARSILADGLASVTPPKQQRLARAALHYLAQHHRYAQHSLRFDVMVVTSRFRIHHMKDAWRVP